MRYVHICIFPYDGITRIRFAGEGSTSPNLSRNRPAPRRVICSAIRCNYTRTGGKCQWIVVRSVQIGGYGRFSLEKRGIRDMMIQNIGSRRMSYEKNENYLHHRAGL